MSSTEIYTSVITSVVSEHFGEAKVPIALQILHQNYLGKDTISWKYYSLEVAKAVGHDGKTGNFYLALCKHYLSLVNEDKNSKSTPSKNSNEMADWTNNAKSLFKKLGQSKGAALIIKSDNANQIKKDDVLPAKAASTAAIVIFRFLFRTFLNKLCDNLEDKPQLVHRLLTRSLQHLDDTNLTLDDWVLWLLQDKEIVYYPNLSVIQAFLQEFYAVACGHFGPILTDESLAFAIKQANNRPEAKEFNPKNFL